VQDDDETPADDLKGLLTEWAGAVSEVTRVTADTGTKVIEAVRELLTAFPMPSESPGPTQNTASGDQRSLSTAAELTQSPSGLSQYQSLAMLAGIVRWFSRESGRSEAEILDGLAANFRH
jgi:hypothetical protein